MPYARVEISPIGRALLAAVAATACGLVIPLVIERIIDGPVAEGDMRELAIMCGIVLGLSALEAVFFLARQRLVIAPSARVEVRMREALYAHIQRLSPAFHDGWPSGQLLSRATVDLNAISRFLRYSLVYLVVNAFSIVAGLGILFWMSPLLGLIFTVIILPVGINAMIFEAKYQEHSEIAQDQRGDLTTHVEESVLGVRVLKAFGRSKQATAAFRHTAELLRKTEMKRAHVLGLLVASVVGLPEFALGVVLVIGGSLVARGTMSNGELVAAIAIVAFLQWPLESNGYLIAEANEAAAATKRYFALLDAEVTITDPGQPEPLPEPVRGGVVFEGAHFRHPGAQMDLLAGIDLEIRPGETLALVGATGSGKSVLAGAITRLHDLTGGRILLDGTDIRRLPLAALRGEVAMVFEDPVLFSGTIARNVRLDRDHLTDAQVREALRVANAEEFVDALPFGLETQVGEQGFALSGGQRQRIALARAVVGRPKLLVMDNPLSALDVHTEAEVEAALRRVLRDATALVVAHRPNTVYLADRVALLDEGRIVAVGAHRQLLRECPRYRALMAPHEVEVAGRTMP
ncbi:ABC transporter ATP-binding protein [Nocardia panacis]|nr:ABC transporter ATP-binding protein [Nocardia panacis]